MGLTCQRARVVLGLEQKPKGKVLVDPISFIELSYDLSGTNEAWLERLLSLAKYELDRGNGVVVAELGVHRHERQNSLCCLAYPNRESKIHFMRVGDQIDGEVLRSLARFGPRTASIYDLLNWNIVNIQCFRKLSTVTDGCRDFFSVRGWEPGTLTGVVFSAPMSVVARSTKQTIFVWDRLAQHLQSAYRLRKSLQRDLTIDDDCPQAEAIFQPSGRLLHAKGQARCVDAQSRLRERVLYIEKLRSGRRRRDSEDALRNWQPLVEGRWSVVDRFENNGQRYIVAYANTINDGNPLRLTAVEQKIAEGFVQGKAQKFLAAELNIDPSRLNKYIAQIGRKLGAKSKIDLIEVLKTYRAGQLFEFPLGEKNIAVWSQDSPQAPSKLSSSEQHIYREMLRGSTNQMIAKIRGTSTRTVANQIASIFSKLGVNSRGELAALSRNQP